MRARGAHENLDRNAHLETSCKRAWRASRSSGLACFPLKRVGRTKKTPGHCWPG